MTASDADVNWQKQLEDAWSALGDSAPDAFVKRMERVVSDPAVPDERRAFEMACAHDSTGRSDLAIPLYREALDQGLTGYERRRTAIQLASSLRNLGRSDESVEILAGESTELGDGLDDAVVVFRSLAMADVGREREALVQALHALADHLPRYTASAHRYADLLADVDIETRGRT
jgi:hypothetical protein